VPQLPRISSWKTSSFGPPENSAQEIKHKKAIKIAAPPTKITSDYFVDAGRTASGPIEMPAEQQKAKRERVALSK